MSRLKIRVAYDVIATFCKKWRISEFAVFGSALREDFDDTSDVDVVVAFEVGAAWSLADVAVMAAELEEMFGRPVDILEKEAIRNPFRRHEVLTTREVLYAA
jgi:predicted nucleotidyltransferase